MFVELSKGVALLLALCLLQGFVYRHWSRNEVAGQIVSGLVFGAVCIIGMLAPLEMVPGVIFDPRSVVLGMAGFFGGPITGAVAGVIVAGYRIWLGGGGAPVGVAVVVSCVVLGLAYREAHRREWVGVGFWPFLIFGLAVHLWSVFLFTFLPDPIADKVMDTVALPFILTFTPGTALLGLLLRIVYDQVDASRRLEESEARFRDMTESSSDWFWETDENMRFTLLSERFREITGIHEDCVIGKTREELALDDLAAEAWRLHHFDIAERLPVRGFTYDISAPDGKRLTISINGKPVFGRDGRFRGYRGTATDITDQRQAETIRDRALVAAEQANEAKSEFLATMSHELRTPLNAIIGFSDILKHQYLGTVDTDTYREYGGYILSSAHHLLELVDDLLDLSTIEAGAMPLETVTLSVDKIVSECTRAVYTKALSKDIELRTDLAPDLPAVLADRRAVKQVMLNLLANAVKFTPEGGFITIAVIATGNQTRITVKDTGNGISAEQLATVTSPFMRAVPSTLKSDAGWGLGLSISKGLVELHGGELEIESEVGTGTAVSFTLPNAELSIGMVLEMSA